MSHRHREAWFVVVLAVWVAGCAGSGTLYDAVKKGDLERAGRLLAEGADPNAKYACGDTSLHLAAMQDHSEDMVRLLLEHGALPNAVNDMEWTPLHRVVNPEVVVLLICHGADVNARDRYGMTPLQIIVGTEHGRVEVQGAPLEEAKKIAEAVDSRRRAVIVFLIQKGAEVEARDKEGLTALHHAAIAGHIEDVRTLVDQGARIDEKDSKYGKTAAEWARSAGQDSVAEWLENKNLGHSGEAHKPSVSSQP